jgi:hypothetical protein
MVPEAESKQKNLALFSDAWDHCTGDADQQKYHKISSRPGMESQVRY